MKKLICVLLAVVIIVAGCCSCGAPLHKENGYVLVASFYPIYIFTANLVDGIDDFRVESLAQQNVGCLHDYSLTAKDVKLLDDADLFVMNGAGMETFMEDVFEGVDGLKVVDSSEGIEVLCNHKHHEGAEESSHHHHGENSHIWLSVKNAKKQIENIKNGIIENFPQYEDEINENFEKYLLRLAELEKARDEFSEQVKGKKAVSFHGAYEYLAAETGFVISETIETDDGGEPSAKELAELSELIKNEKIKALLTEPEYEGSAAEILARETGAEIYELNPVISGDRSLTAYEDTMKKNYETILKAVK